MSKVLLTRPKKDGLKTSLTLKRFLTGYKQNRKNLRKEKDLFNVKIIHLEPGLTARKNKRKTHFCPHNLNY